VIKHLDILDVFSSEKNLSCLWHVMRGRVQTDDSRRCLARAPEQVAVSSREW
jgi:hypothetical protein